MVMEKKEKKDKALLDSMKSSDFLAHGLLSSLPLQSVQVKDSFLREPSTSGQQSKAAEGSADLFLLSEEEML